MKRIFALIFVLSLTFCVFCENFAIADDVWSSFSRLESLYIIAPDDLHLPIYAARSEIESIVGNPLSAPLEYVAPSIVDDRQHPIDFGSLFDLCYPYPITIEYDGISVRYDTRIIEPIMNSMYSSLESEFDFLSNGTYSFIRNLDDAERASCFSEMLEIITPYCESVYQSYMNDIVAIGYTLSSPKYELFNGMYVGQNLDEYATILNTDSRMFHDDKSYYNRNSTNDYVLLDALYFLNARAEYSESDIVFVVSINADDNERYIESIDLLPDKFY